MLSTRFYYLLLLIVQPVVSVPAPDADFNPEYSLSKRDIFDDLISQLPSNLRNDLQQGILQNYFAKIPSVQDIQRDLGLPTLSPQNVIREVLNVPGYANYSTQTGKWSVRFHGQVHNLPFYNASQETQRNLINTFLPDVDYSSLQDHEKDNARNLTAEFFSVPVEGVQLQMELKFANENPATSNWKEDFTFPMATDSRGEFDGFVPLNDSTNGLPKGDVQGGVVAMLDVWTKGESTGNSTAYLVPKQGITILSDIDDILRVTKIWIPKEGLLNSFARDFTPWMNMPQRFYEWSQQTAPGSNSNNNKQITGYHFHYLTTTPEQATQRYMNFIYNNYPLGSFDTRSLNFTTVSQTFGVRLFLLNKIFQTFPQRKFVLLGDISNSDVLRDYPSLATTYPGQVQCILIRNVSNTDPTDKLPYDISGFANLKKEMYMFYDVPDDLKGLNFYNGDCVNASASGPKFDPSVGFGWRNLPRGLASIINQGKGGAGSVSVGKGMLYGLMGVMGVMMLL